MINPENSNSPWDSNLENRTLSDELINIKNRWPDRNLQVSVRFLFNGFALEGQEMPGLCGFERSHLPGKKATL